MRLNSHQVRRCSGVTVSKASIRIKDVLILVGIVVALEAPIELMATKSVDEDTHHCRELKDYLEYSEDRLKAMHQLEIKFKRDQADYNNFCSTK